MFRTRGTAWRMEHVATHPAATLTYVDTFAGGAEHTGLERGGLETWFRANTAKHQAKLFGRKGRSDEMLVGLPRGHFDFVSIDGSHEAADVLSDAVLCWPLLRPGGLVCFDDYGWWTDPAPERSSKLAVDAFLAVMKGRCEVVKKDYQVWVRKPR